MDKLIGKKIVLEYGDHNTDFESIFHRSGKITSRHITDNVNDWYLVNLDEPFDYNGRVNTQVLIRSRWKGVKIQDDDASVFVLLIPDPELITDEKINFEDYEHVVWGSTRLC